MSAVKVVVEDAGPCRKDLAIEVPADDVKAEYQKVLGTYTGAARIKGFRPGRAPVALVERHYAKSILQDVKDALLSRGYRLALEQQSLKPVSIVDVGEAQVLLDAPFSFKVTVDVPPEFELPEYTGVPVTGRTVQVKDEAVDQLIERLRERAAQYPVAEGRAIAKGDLAKIDYEGRLDGKPLGEAVEGCTELAKGTDFWLATDGPEFLPGLAAQVEGLEPGATREVRIEFPADYHVKEVAGRTADYTVTVKEIRERKLPELNDEFAVLMGAASLDELRARVRTDLEQAAQREEDNRRRSAVIRHLLEKAGISDLPQSVVQEEIGHVVRDIVRENTMRGATREQIQEHRDDIMNAASQSSQDRVKLSYILRRIAEKEGVTVEESEVEAHIAALAQRHRMPAAKMREELEKRDAFEGIRGDIRSAKTLDTVMSRAVVTIDDSASETADGQVTA